MTPRMFSFNSPFGACSGCAGLGYQMKIDPDLVIPDKNKSLYQGAINVSGWNSGNSNNQIASMYYEGLANHFGFDLDTPIKDLPDKAVDAILYGTKGKKIKLTYRKG